MLTHLPQFETSESNTCEVQNSLGETLNVYDRTLADPNECGPLSVGRWLNQATAFIFVNGNVRLAEHDEEGNEYDPVFPFQLKFVANPALEPTDGDTRFYD